jgi:hypothetical protein
VQLDLTVDVGRLQGLMILVASLLPDGKRRELFEGPLLSTATCARSLHLSKKTLFHDVFHSNSWDHPTAEETSLSEEDEVFGGESFKHLEVTIRDSGPLTNRLCWYVDRELGQYLRSKRSLRLIPSAEMTSGTYDMIAILESPMYRSVVDDEFRALLEAAPELYGLEGLVLPEAVEPEVQQDLVGVSMADVDFQVCDTTCSWAVTVRCDRFTV